MILYRLSKQQYINDLSGRGAELTGGRWNSKGIPVLYTAESRALAAIEIAVHIPLGILPSNYHLATIQIPDIERAARINIEDLPSRWDAHPFIKITQQVGDNFVKANKHLLLQVPSATVKGDHNYLINPRHADFSKVKIIGIEPFEFDSRLFKKG
ncbi:RES superfamily protein [Mucilaginibacter sp. PPCGB 2223]|uniref:RES family NAD+ phosphorylase n=1 Tax=Mucilaginibacter sp. PPCGB 2223 TaxID=1886027 RepID=UPI0008263617|nr:RES family NAD+ phosphorylase [Mucilaginibacter sp. PPCGB 2223]OCX50757.1 RES superfamily protein [Mucilaginibacter sp. PPCGB 2223]